MAQLTAQEHYERAEHLLTVTFPLTKEPKLLLGVLHALSMVFEKAPAHYHKERQELRELLNLQRHCLYQFQRGNTYVLATKEYELKVISPSLLKSYLLCARNFLDNRKA